MDSLVKDSLASKNRPELVTLPECFVSEIQINRKKYFLVQFIVVQAKTRMILITS